MRLIVGVAVGFCLAAPVRAQEDVDARGSVAVMGVVHAPGQFRVDELSPGFIRRAIELLDPEVICVESNPEWFARGQFYRATYEAQSIAVPWARERELPVYGVDWIGDSSSSYAERQRLARIAREREGLATGQSIATRFSYGASRERQLEPYAGGARGFVDYNSEEYGRERLEWLAAGEDDVGSAANYIAERDRRIVGFIDQVLKRHPQARVLVVLGAAHKANVESQLSALGHDVVPTDEWLEAVKREESDGSLTAGDAAAILCDAFDNEQGQTISGRRVARLFERIGDGNATLRSGLADYLRARYEQLSGGAPLAEQLFQRVLDAGVSDFPHPGTTWRHHLSIQQAALLELGRLADLAGDRELALAYYEELADSLPEPVDSDDYHAPFEFHARAVNAVRALCTEPYRHEWAFATAPQPQAMARQDPGRAAAQQQSLKRAWELHRAKQWTKLRELVTPLREVAGLHGLQQLEVTLHLVAAEVSLGDADAAVQWLEALDAQLDQRPQFRAPHWLGKMRDGLAERVIR